MQQDAPNIAVSRANLPLLGRRLSVPGYDTASIAAGIVHLGPGGFHRAHMARYTHDLLDRSAEARSWGIVGAGLQPTDRATCKALAPQDWLYTLVERDGAAEAATVIGSVINIIDAAETSLELLREIDRETVRIVSLTVTEHGYCLNRATKLLDFAHPLILEDLAAPRIPRSAIGVLCEAYRRRMQSGQRGFTVLSCDNIQHNGRVLERAVLDFAERLDPALATWIRRSASFPSTMVDRITPITVPGDVADLTKQYKIVDCRPVFCETFRQWVIEDHFVSGRPEWEAVGAQFVADVAPYEFMKLRLLNASHLAIASLGRLAGYSLIDETMRDDLFARYMLALMDRETGPTLPPVPGIDLAQYQRTLVRRFSNPSLRDTVERVNTDAPLNVLIDPLRDRLRGGGNVALLALALAAWMRRIRGVDEGGQLINVVHPLAGILRERAIQGGADPRPLLAIRSLFGDLGEDEAFTTQLSRWLGSLYDKGVRRTLLEASDKQTF
jgi:mannitol 2-dehydrogenase